MHGGLSPLELTFGLNVDWKNSIVKTAGQIDKVDAFFFLLLELERLSREFL